MSFNRLIYSSLVEWRKRVKRKPLILRGARQVGKTTLIHQFAEEYPFKILLNLEKKEDRDYFDQYNDVQTIVEALLLTYKIDPQNLSKTLLFLDEIQASPKAIQLLRYFYEEIPELHVISAGSLLEFAMQEVKSFPVGRVEYLYLYPLNFREFLEAIGHDLAGKQLDQIPVKNFAHNLLIDLFNRYVIIGGMPEAVSTFIEQKNLASLPIVYRSIWQTYESDVEKYASNETERKVIKHIIATAPYMIDKRIKFQHFGYSNYRSREVGEAMRTLDDARVMRLIYPSTNTSFPLLPDLKKSPRLQFLDTGIINYVLGIQAELLSLKDLHSAFRGAIIPHVVNQELISNNTYEDKKPIFWVREKSNSNAEIDLLYQHRNMAIPIEIKAGKTGTLKSLHYFMEQVEHPYAIRIFGGDFSIIPQTGAKGKSYFLMNLPYYLMTKIEDYVIYFVNNYNEENLMV